MSFRRSVLLDTNILNSCVLCLLGLEGFAVSSNQVPRLHVKPLVRLLKLDHGSIWRFGIITLLRSSSRSPDPFWLQLASGIKHACPSHVLFSTVAWGSPSDLLSYTRVTVISALGPCYLLAGAVLRGPERGCGLNGQPAPSKDGSVCLVLRCLMVSQGGSVLVLFGSLWCLL